MIFGSEAVSASGMAGDARTGAAAFADWTVDTPGVRRLIRPSDLPAPPTTVNDPLRVGMR